jgi:hypothetical protein
MMQVNRQHVLLGVLGVVAVWAVYYSFGPGDGDAQPGMDRRPGPGGDLNDLPIVLVKGPGAEPDSFDPQGRNLFAYGQPKRVAPPPGAAPNARRPTAPKVVPKAPPKAPNVARVPTGQAAPQKAIPPAINFKFLGYLGPEGGLIGIFQMTTDDGEEIVLAGEGETVGEKFRVHRIGYEEVEIGYTEEVFENERKVLAMGGRS